MCTLLMYRRPLAGVDLAVAANRDELYRRPPGVFGVLAEEPLVLGGCDPEQGGTWLAASSAGFVVAVTNARLQAQRREDQRSRGLLALDLAMLPSATAAVERLDAAALDCYAPVNVVVADAEGFAVASNLPEPRCVRLEQRALAVGNVPIFAADDRVTELLELGRVGCEEGREEWASRLRRLLAWHDPPTACHHQSSGGTVSGTVMLLTEIFEESLMWHADGAPCRVPWRRVDPVATTVRSE